MHFLYMVSNMSTRRRALFLSVPGDYIVISTHLDSMDRMGPPTFCGHPTGPPVRRRLFYFFKVLR